MVKNGEKSRPIKYKYMGKLSEKQLVTTMSDNDCIILSLSDNTIVRIKKSVLLSVFKSDIKIGGRNLAVGTGKIDPFSVTSGMPGKTFTIVSLFQNLILENWYMISFDAKFVSGDGVLHFEFNGSLGGNVIIDSTEWKRYGVLSKYYKGKSLYFWLISGTGEIQVKDIKIENGNMPTDWTPAVEEMINT